MNYPTESNEDWKICVNVLLIVQNGHAAVWMEFYPGL